MPEFVKVASMEELSRDMGKVVEVKGEEIALFKVEDEVYALENMCPHQAGPLGDGYLDADVVTCPFHAWQINVRTGEVVFIPGLCAKTYRCKVEGGAVYVEV